MKLGAKELRASRPTRTDLAKIKRRDIYIICDNILDTYNIGSIFRLADAGGAKKIYLCAKTETPPNSRISKSSVGTDKWVPWQYIASAKTAISNLKFLISNVRVIAVEQSPKAVDYRKVNYKQSFSSNKEPVAFVVGHETSGVSKEALKLCDQIVEIPMYGVNRSLNVMVSLAIVLYKAVEF